ncbi:MAG: hypothetical protein QGF00_32930 [Planctomycetota bacterium]|nr:hypothetical protein [Planctomycetota bacterium]MDP7254447.1 hypothetical protein [Planctomycetota bacterium]
MADVDHCHYTTEEFSSYNYPREKKVGGICDYKGFVHWASGGRRAYNSAADAMLWHHYMTGNARSLTPALEHGELLLWDGRPLPHREGSGRATSAAALYFKTWDNAYLEFLEKTVERLLSTQREDGSFPQWEDFAPYLQRYVDVTQSRRGMKAMIRWLIGYSPVRIRRPVITPRRTSLRTRPSTQAVRNAFLSRRTRSLISLTTSTRAATLDTRAFRFRITPTCISRTSCRKFFITCTRSTHLAKHHRQRSSRGRPSAACHGRKWMAKRPMSSTHASGRKRKGHSR